jgi:hypothetical protein
MRTRDHQLNNEQKRAIKSNANLSAPSKRVKITPSEKNTQNQGENVPNTVNKKPTNSRTAGKSNSIDESTFKKKYSFASKPYANEVHQSQFQTEVCYSYYC